MNTLIRHLITSMLLLAITPPLLAVQVRGQGASGSAGYSSVSIVERGGEVNSVDLKKGVIVIDGVSYEFIPQTVKINASSLGKNVTKPSDLKVGMKIRFSTSKNYSSGQDNVREVWVSDGAIR